MERQARKSDAPLECPECRGALSALKADDYGNVTASCKACNAVFDFDDLHCVLPEPSRPPEKLRDSGPPPAL